MKTEYSKKANAAIWATYEVHMYQIECPWCKTIIRRELDAQMALDTTIRCYHCYRLIRLANVEKSSKSVNEPLRTGLPPVTGG